MSTASTTSIRVPVALYAIARNIADGYDHETLTFEFGTAERARMEAVIAEHSEVSK